MAMVFNEPNSFNSAVSPEVDSSVPTPFQRVLLTFTAPSQAFRHLAGASWWLPYILIVLVSLGFGATIEKQVGWQAVAKNNIAASPKQQARVDQLPPTQQALQIGVIARIIRISSYVASFVATPVLAAVVAGVLLLSLNFGLGGHARFSPLFALYLLSTLPQMLKLLLVILLLFLGIGNDAFQIGNPLGSNPAFYLQGSATPQWLLSVLKWLDAFTIWQLVLLGVGCSLIAKVSRGKAATVIAAWVALLVLISAASSLLS